MKVKFVTRKNEVFLIDAPENLVFQSKIVNNLARFALVKPLGGSMLSEIEEEKWQEKSTEYSVYIDKLIRPILIKNNLLKVDSDYSDCDMNIDEVYPSAKEILEEDVILKYEIIIF